MCRYLLSLLLFIGLAWGQNTNSSNFNFENRVLRFKKADKVIIIMHNQQLYINDSLMVYKSLDFNNKKIKFESTNEVIMSFDDINSFRYKKSFNISNSLDKAGKYGKTGGTIGCVFGLYGMTQIISQSSDALALMAITAPLIPAFFGGCGGILGGFVGLLSPSFGNAMLVSDSEWIIIDKE